MKIFKMMLLCSLVLSACSNNEQKLMEELRNPSPVIRAGALKTLALKGGDESYLLVTKYQSDSSSIVRIAAVQALDLFKDKETIAAVIRATRDADPEVREAAVEVLESRKSDDSKNALVKMLLRGESNLKVRKRVYDALSSKGLSGERLGGELAESQMSQIRAEMPEVQTQDQVEMVRKAGRSIHPGGIDLVLNALTAQEQSIVVAALDVLNGRGGAKALQNMQVLLADQVDEIRLACVRALPVYGESGLKLMEISLRDHSAKVRLAALQKFAKHEHKLQSQLLCPLFLDGDDRVAISAASLIREQNTACDIAPLERMLANASNEKHSSLLGVLSSMGGKKAISILSRELTRQSKTSPKEPSVKAIDQASILVALARAGDRDPKTAKKLKLHFEQAVEDIANLEESWVAGKIPALSSDESSKKSKPRDYRRPGRNLSDEELKDLYKKHGLGPASDNAPRGVGDILAGFPGEKKDEKLGKLFKPIARFHEERVGMLLDGILFISPGDALPLIEKALNFPRARVVGHTAEVLLAHNVSIKLSDAMLENIKTILKDAGKLDIEALSALLAGSGDQKAVPLLISALKDASWEERETLIGALGELASADALEPLIAQLEGYSAIPAAQALAKLKDAKAVEPLKLALRRAGPAEELEILMALARLDFKGIIPTLKHKLHSSDPYVRQFTVRILGEMGGEQARSALNEARYDVDRLVREEVKRVLERGKPQEKSNVSPQPTKEG